MPYQGTPLVLNKKCDIQRASTTPNAWGEDRISTWVTIVEDVRCRILSKTAMEVLDGKLVRIVRDMILLPFGTDITTDDRISYLGDTFEVKGINPNPGSSDHHMEAEIMRVAE